MTRYIKSYAERGIILDPFQIEACRVLDEGRDVLVCAPTGSGKTVVARYAVELAIEQRKRCIYTAPIKALSNQKYHELAEECGAENVGLLTGDTTINSQAQILVVTTEVLRNMLIHHASLVDDIGYAVLDEVHYLADRERGPVWEEVILSLPRHVRLVSLSATVSNTSELLGWLSSVRGRTALVTSDTRPVPLSQHIAIRRRLYPLYEGEQVSGKTLEPSQSARQALSHIGERHHRVGPKERNNIVHLLRQNDLLPAIEFIFSRKACDNAVQGLLHLGVCLTSESEQREITRRVGELADKLSTSDKRAIDFSQRVQEMANGYAAHHAGVYPPLKELTEHLMSVGLLKLVYATGTLALGIDMPVRSVVLEDISRWDGDGFVELSAREYTQLIGRAGRRGKDDHGHALVVGTSHLDLNRLAELGSGEVEPLISAFFSSYNTVVNLLARMSEGEARALLSRSFAQYQRNSDVVEIQERLGKIEEAIDVEKARLDCDRGELIEYLRLRANAPRARKGMRKRARDAYREEIARSWRHTREGHIYAYARGGELTYGLVLSRHGKKIRVLDWDGVIEWLHKNDLSSHMREIGKCQLPQGLSLRSYEGKEAILEAVGDMVLERDELGLDRDLKASWNRFAESDEAAYTEHPCHSCPECDAHIVQGRDFLALEAEKKRLEGIADQYRDSSGRDFDATLGVLGDMGLVDRSDSGEISLSRGASWLQELHLEDDLLLYECLLGLRDNQLSAEEMAGWASQFLADDRLGGRMPSSSLLRSLTLYAQQQTDFLCALERSHGIERTRDVTPGCVDAFVLWAQGAPLEDCLESSRLSAGDFITAARRLVDLLGQIAAAGSGTWIGDTASQARRLVRRGELE